jgi:SAM-dependent methyltransferase
VGSDRRSAAVSEEHNLPDSDPYRGRLAQFYDSGTATDADLDIYLGFAKRLGGPVLELGCGSGRVMAALADCGYDVVGIDRSPDMLGLAHRRLAAFEVHHPLVQADMAHLPLASRFKLIIIALDSFLHLTSRARQIATLHQVRRTLARDGLMILDIPGPVAAGWDDWSTGIRPLVPAWSVPVEDGGCLSKYSSFSVDGSRQTHTVSEIYEISHTDGTLQRWLARYELRFVFPAELELLLESSGLKLIDRYGDYALEPFDAESERQVCVIAAARGGSNKRWSEE